MVPYWIMGSKVQVCLLIISIQVLLVAAKTNHLDLVALLSLRNTWENTPPNWVGTDPCGYGWEGIRCNNSRVTAITLADMDLRGELPGEIQSLSELQILDLSYNKGLTGSLPQSIGYLTKLSNLILVGCSFTGQIPYTIGSLQQLYILSLNSNDFSGEIPHTIGSLSKLYWLDLADNKLSGTIPVSSRTRPGLDMLVNTKHFHFGKNQLSGEIPSQLFNSNMSLIHVLFESNNLNGSIPSTLGLLQNLEVLRLDRNKLTGSIPSNLNDLVQVSELFLSNNQLTGPLPDLTGMNVLNYVDISNNTFEVSDFPPWFSTLQSLTTLMMENTRLQGPIPAELFSLPLLQSIVVRYNQLNGTLDLGSSNSNQLQLIDLRNNLIFGFADGTKFHIDGAGFNISLLLTGNPVCEETGETKTYCSNQQSTPSYSTPTKNCTPATCSSDKISSPYCRCANPYNGTLFFRAPSFSDLGNSDIYLSLETSLMHYFKSHQFPVDSVSLSTATRDAGDYFELRLKIFPLGDDHFNRTEISGIAFALSNQTFKPPKTFGPFFFIGYPYGYFAGADDEQYTSCNRLFQCGDLWKIGYPFWGGHRPNYCGDPSFELTCKNNIPEITIESTAYRVLAIDETSQVLTVARNDYWNTLCPTQLRNNSLDLAHFSYGSDSQELMLYYDCRILSNPTTIPNQFNCSVNGISNSTGVFDVRGDPFPFDSQLVSCSTGVRVQVSFAVAQALARASSEINVKQLLDTGFALQWKANDTNCKRCVLSGGRCGSNSSSFACYCPDQAYDLTCGNSSMNGGTGSSKGFSQQLKVVIGVSVGVFAITILIITIYCLERKGTLSVNVMAFWKKERLEDQIVEAFIRQYGSLAPKHYRYSDINKMTNAFKEKLGEGGYGVVYKGKLSDDHLVAVKILSDTKGNGEEFINEVASISRTSHVNVVALLGFCFERNRRALIYEFVAKGSLDKLIYNDESLEWKTLYEIATGIARGLEYLHRGCSTRIVHFDIKPHNILLDEDFCPKISDFGLAKLCQRKQSIISVLGARGTAGYIAPEMLSRAFGGVSHKSDVYSYGMLILEITGARENPEVVQTSEVYFPEWIYEHLEHGKDLRLVRVPTREEEETARKMILVGLWCIQSHPSDRPSMSKVLEMLEGSLESLQIPPRPSILSPLRLQTSASDSLSSTMNLEVEMSASNPSSFQIPSKSLQFSTARSGQPASSKTWA